MFYSICTAIGFLFLCCIGIVIVLACIYPVVCEITSYLENKQRTKISELKRENQALKEELSSRNRPKMPNFHGVTESTL